MRLFLKRPCIAGGCSWTKMIVYDQISWRELIFVIYLAYLEANLNDSFLGDLGIDFVNPSVNTVLVYKLVQSISISQTKYNSSLLLHCVFYLILDSDTYALICL